MKKFSLFVAALLVSAMSMAEVLVIDASVVKSTYSSADTTTIGDVKVAYSGVMYNGKGTPTNYASKQVLQLRKSGNGAGEISNVTAVEISSIQIIHQNDVDFTLLAGDDKAKMDTLVKPAATDTTIAVEHKSGGTLDMQAKVYKFSVGDKKYFKLVNGTKAAYIYNIEVTYENVATDVENVAEKASFKKAVKNGQIVIIRNGEMFNLQGARIQ